MHHIPAASVGPARVVRDDVWSGEHNPGTLNSSIRVPCGIIQLNRRVYYSDFELSLDIHFSSIVHFACNDNNVEK